MKKVIIIFAILFPITGIFGQQHVKNVIVMIPDGAALSLVSIARYYNQWESGNLDTALAIDPYLCAFLRSTCSDAPIGDSAPTGSCYATGQPAMKGNISIYPLPSNQDLYNIDSSRAYQPLATLLECAKLKKKSTGLVVTCEFSHATPAGFASHYYDRNAEEILTKQMVFNNIDVVLGGGSKYLTPYNDYLKSKGYQILTTKKEFSECSSNKYWGVFDRMELPYYIDQDTAAIPSLAEMTQKAIESLSQNPNGFFLMVEGSLVDWALHNQDAKTAIIEFLEFNRAVEKVMKYAINDGNTLVIIMPDHGTSGISMGNKNSNVGYYKKSLNQFFEPLNMQTQSLKLDPIIRKKLKKTSLIGFTTLGHTGEDLFLAVYNPFQNTPKGHVKNYEINPYICRSLGWENNLSQITDSLYVPHTQVYPNIVGIINNENRLNPTLTYIINGKKVVYYGFTNYATVDGQKIEFSSVIIFIDKNSTFYIPKQKIM
jgi:alkaline phosphatase